MIWEDNIKGMCRNISIQHIPVGFNYFQTVLWKISTLHQINLQLPQPLLLPLQPAVQELQRRSEVQDRDVSFGQRF